MMPFFRRRSAAGALASAVATAIFATACADAPEPAAEPPRAVERCLTDTPFEERDGDWSPDGQWIVFGSSVGGDEDLYKMRVDGGEPIQLTSGPSEDLYAEWSPDGSRILFTSNRGGGTDNIWTMDVDGGDLRQVTRSTDQVVNRGAHLATWSPDGQRIAFESTRGGKHIGLWSLPADGGEATPLTLAQQGAERFGAWSPDGTEIAFARLVDQEGNNSDIYVRNLNTGAERLLAPHPGDDWNTDWSPDGHWIVFCSWRGGEIDLWVVAADGSGEPINVTNTRDRRDYVPRWAPDSRRLVYNSVPMDFVHLLVDPDGGNPRRAPLQRLNMVWGADDDEIISFDDEGRPWRFTLSTGDSSLVTDAPIRSSFSAGRRVSPDGRFLSFVGDWFTGAPQIFLLPLAGGRPRQVTASPMRERQRVDWSPDSRSLVFSGMAADGTVDIWTVPANGGLEARLTQGRGESIWPDWSPDGEHIAYVRVDSSGHHIHTMDADGSNGRFLVEGSYPQWTPDGEHLLFTRGTSIAPQDLYRISAAGGEPELFYDGPGPLYGWQWSPSGKLLMISNRVAGNLYILDVGPLLDAYGSSVP